jgi:DNA Polymerase alpha zinc finger
MYCYFSNRVTALVRQCVKKYYDCWLICDDNSCGRRSMQQASKGAPLPLPYLPSSPIQLHFSPPFPSPLYCSAPFNSSLYSSSFATPCFLSFLYRSFFADYTCTENCHGRMVQEYSEVTCPSRRLCSKPANDCSALLCPAVLC